MLDWSSHAVRVRQSSSTSLRSLESEKQDRKTMAYPEEETAYHKVSLPRETWTRVQLAELLSTSWQTSSTHSSLLLVGFRREQDHERQETRES